MLDSKTSNKAKYKNNESDIWISMTYIVWWDNVGKKTLRTYLNYHVMKPIGNFRNCVHEMKWKVKQMRQNKVTMNKAKYPSELLHFYLVEH